MNPYYGIFFLIFIFMTSMFFILASTEGDVKTFKDRKLRYKVSTDVRPNMSYGKIRGIFLKQNIWEMTFFWYGVFMGMFLAMMIGGFF